MVQVGLAESLPRVMVQVGWAESPPRVVPLLNINTLPEFWVCLSEWATCLSALTAARELWFMGPSASSVPIPKANPDVIVQRCRADCWGERILSESKGQDDGLGPRPVAQRAGALRVSGRRQAFALRIRPACATSLESLGRTSACRFAEAGHDPRKGVSGQS